MPERDMNPRAGTPRRFRIDADAGETAIEIVLPEQLPNNRPPTNYRIVKKDIPAEASAARFRNKDVKWINNFGIRLRGSFRVKPGGNRQDPFFSDVDDDNEQFEYEVVVPKPAPQGYPTLVYFDSTGTTPEVKPATITRETTEAYHFNLIIGDPPAGWGGG